MAVRVAPTWVIPVDTVTMVLECAWPCPTRLLRPVRLVFYASSALPAPLKDKGSHVAARAGGNERQQLDLLFDSLEASSLFTSKLRPALEPNPATAAHGGGGRWRPYPEAPTEWSAVSRQFGHAHYVRVHLEPHVAITIEPFLRPDWLVRQVLDCLARLLMPSAAQQSRQHHRDRTSSPVAAAEDGLLRQLQSVSLLIVRYLVRSP